MNSLFERLADRSATIGIVGLGYVGFPLALEAAKAGFQAVGFDVNRGIVERINAGESHIGDVPAAEVAPLVAAGRLGATTDSSRLGACDVIVICVPTPLSKIKDPDLSYVVAAAESVQRVLRPGQLVILESTTYPGTTRELVQPILEQGGPRVGEEIFLCFSPERVDPGNPSWHIANTPKLVGGMTPACLRAGVAFYETIVERVVPVSSAEVAELAKVYENTFRMVNIALANELALICDRLGLDVWEVIDAAATKPFGFMRFTPGPGLGGHCIPLDPHYLSWKMENLAFKTRLIDLASEINASMPAAVVSLVTDALNDVARAVRGSRILVLGIAYKPDVADDRESPALEIIDLLQQRGAAVSFHDPLCAAIHDDGVHQIAGLPMRSVALDEATVSAADAVVVVTNHSTFDYGWLAETASLIIDTRGALRGLGGRARIVGLSGQAGSTAASPELVPARAF